MGNLNKTLVYHLVDTLGITAEIDNSKDAISGEGSFEIALGTLKVPFPLKITGSRGGTRELLVTAKCVGNLGLLLHVTPEGQFGRITLHLLNLAKIGPDRQLAEGQCAGLARQGRRDARQGGGEELPQDDEERLVRDLIA